MDLPQFIEDNKVYVETLKQWVIPVDKVEQYFSENQTQTLTEDITQLQDSLKQLDTLFSSLSNLDTTNG